MVGCMVIRTTTIPGSKLPKTLPSGKHTKKNLENHHFLMGKSTNSMTMFHSKMLVYQRVTTKNCFKPARIWHEFHQQEIGFQLPTTWFAIVSFDQQHWCVWHRLTTRDDFLPANGVLHTLSSIYIYIYITCSKWLWKVIVRFHVELRLYRPAMKYRHPS